MDIGSIHVNLSELAGALIALWGGFSFWRIKYMKAKILAEQNRASEIETDVFPTNLNQGGPDGQAR